MLYAFVDTAFIIASTAWTTHKGNKLISIWQYTIMQLSSYQLTPYSQETNLNVFHHGAFLSIQLGAVGTLEHMHFLLGQVSVKVHVQQGLLGENCVAHYTLVDHSVKGEKDTDGESFQTPLRNWNFNKILRK